MTTSLLEQFKRVRKKGPIRVAWYDDHPDYVGSLHAELNKRGFEAKLYDEPADIIRDITEAFQKRGPRNVPDVCIADLFIDRSREALTPDFDGVRVAETIIGRYESRMDVPARVGTATHKTELFAKASPDVFCFRYLTSELVPTEDGTFAQFEASIKQAAVSLWVDYWCVNYMRNTPIQGYDDTKRFVRQRFKFGYIVGFKGGSAIVELWNPKAIGSRRSYVVDREYLQGYGVTEVQQPFRVVWFADQEQPNAAPKVVERVSEPWEFQFDEVWPEFDPSEFRGLSDV